MEAQYNELERSYSEEDINEIIHIKRKLIFSLEETKRLTMTNQKQKPLLQEYEDKEFYIDDLRSDENPT